MNYTLKIKNLVKEALTCKQYRRMNAVVRVFTIIAMAPFIILGALCVAHYYLILSIFRLATAPLDSLKSFLHKECETRHFAVQMIIYIVCLPFIFFLEVLKAFLVFNLGISYFINNIILFIATLSGITFSPFIFDEENRDYNINYSKLHSSALVFVIIISFFAFFFYLLIFFTEIYSPYYSNAVYYIYEILGNINNSIFGLFKLAFVIVYPIFAFKLKAQDEENKDIVFCPNCGLELRSDVGYCPRCGTKNK